MPVAVITDIHSNLPALEAVLADIDTREIDRIWCLGDVVGYGADPDACADLVRERCELCLVGNHDLAVLGALDIAAFSDAAAEAVVWTQANVEQRTLDFLAGLEPAGTRDGVALFHASPRDPVWEYVLSLDQAQACLAEQPEPVTLIGHSHVSLFFTRPDGGGSPADTVGSQAGDGMRLELDGGDRWLINPGSVGQPRDGNPDAAWLELDTESPAAVFHRLPYDIDRAAAAIVEEGLPKRLADRLYIGQ